MIKKISAILAIILYNTVWYLSGNFPTERGIGAVVYLVGYLSTIPLSFLICVCFDIFNSED